MRFHSILLDIAVRGCVPPNIRGAIIPHLMIIGPLKPRDEAGGYMLSPLCGEENAATPSCAWQRYKLQAFASDKFAEALRAIGLSSETAFATCERLKPSPLRSGVL
jgi:hypothetical protein